jgi:hypothetical protein
MTLSLATTLESLALGQAMLVVPAMGDSYEGKTAATIAALLLMLAQDLEALPGRRYTMRTKLEALLQSAPLADEALAARVSAVLEGPLPGWDAQESRLLGALADVHAWAEAHDADLARRCLDWLVEWSEGERLNPPALPG